jgi:hypothetical protein
MTEGLLGELERKTIYFIALAFGGCPGSVRDLAYFLTSFLFDGGSMPLLVGIGKLKDRVLHKVSMRFDAFWYDSKRKNGASVGLATELDDWIRSVFLIKSKIT